MTRAQTAVLPLTDHEVAELLEGIGTMPTAAELDTPWPIEGVLHPVLTCITGQPEVGKSTLAQSLVGTVLDGRPWLGHSTNFSTSKRVLFGCEDSGGVARVRAVMPEHIATGRLVAFRLQAWTGNSLTARKLRRSDVGLIVLDSAFAAVGDVNDQALSAGFLATLRGLGVPVVVIHHEPKSTGSGPAGAQAFSAAYRHSLRVSKKAGHGLVLSVRITGNDVPGNDKLEVEIDRDTIEPSAVTSNRAVREIRPARPSRPELARRLGEYAWAMGLERPTEGGHNQLATALCGGPRDHEDPATQGRLAAAVGLQSAAHRTVVNLVRDHFDAALDGYENGASSEAA